MNTTMTFHLKRGKEGEGRTFYLDHNLIKLKTNLIMMNIRTIENKVKTVMSNEGSGRYSKVLQDMHISRVWNRPGDLV